MDETGQLHLHDPDRLRATAAALAAATPPDPTQLCGTGKRWRPLPDALALLWQAAAWRDELRQLLPRALPVPLRVHGRTSRAETEAAYCYAEAWRLRDPAR